MCVVLRPRLWAAWLAPLFQRPLAWSYDLLDAEEQRLFRHLSVFVGGCTLEAIESISNAFGNPAVDVLDGVASLIDKSLLHQIEQEEEEPRLMMLETIREYGLECLAASGEMEATQYAHAAYYLALVEETEPERAGTQQTVWLQRLEREHDNLRAALRWMLERAETRRWVGGEKKQVEQALRLCGALFWFWYLRGYFREGRTFLERALAVREGVVAPIRAKALQAQAELGFLLGDIEEIEALCEESLAQAMEGEDTARIASSLEGLASVVTVQRESAWAVQLCGAAEYLRETIDVPLPPVERAEYERLVMTGRAQLGEPVFAAAWAQGRTMTPEQVLAVQGQVMASAPITTVGLPSPTYPAGLTAREVGVLRLVAKGLTNNEIAEELGLSEKTVTHHLTHIFNKTTSENRAAAAAFAIRHGLA